MGRKSDKTIIVGGFVSMAILGLVGTSYLLLGDKDNPKQPVNEIASVEDQDEAHVDIEHASEPNSQVSFENEEKREISEEDIQGYMLESRKLVKDLDFKGVLKLLEPVVNRYNLTGEDGQALANMYTDANLMVAQAEMEDPLERAEVVLGINDPITMAYGFAQLPTDVFLYTVSDINSVTVAGKGNVEVRGDETFYPAILEGEETLNPYFFENPYIKLFLEGDTHFHDMTGIYEIPLRVQGVDVTAYVVAQEDNALVMVGYYVDNPSEYGDRFQTVHWHLSQRQRLEEAVYTNWGEKSETQKEKE